MNSLTATDERTLVLIRTLHASRELVFNAWSDPKHLVRWWGPNDFTLPHCEQDFRVGGTYRFCMRAPDGSDHWVRGRYLEISEPDLLVFTWLREDVPGDIWCDTVVRITLRQQGSRTEMELEQTTFATKDHCDEHREGWSECFDRLAYFLNPKTTSN